MPHLIRQFLTASIALVVLIVTPVAHPYTAGGKPRAAGQTVARILVDASRDGGAWWFPQPGPFDPGLPHQGQPLADHLRAQGKEVVELPRPSTITGALLNQFDLVIRANGYDTPYSSSELNAYTDHVSNGKPLILLADYQRAGETDSLAAFFGLEFRGISVGKNRITQFTPHPINDGVSELPYVVGSGLFNATGAVTILGLLSEDTFIDLNDNGTRDTGEPTAAPVMGIKPFGAGQIFFMGDSNSIEAVSQPFTDNLLNFLASTINTPGFALSFDSATMNAERGTKIRVKVNIGRAAGFSGSVTVIPPDPSMGIKAKPPDSIAITEASGTFKLKVGGGAEVGPHQLTFTGKDDSGRASTATLTVVVQ